MALLISPHVFKQLAVLPRADAKRLLERLERVAEAPQERHVNMVALTGQPGTFRVRQGNWRAVFSIENVDRVAHRREVYR